MSNRAPGTSTVGISGLAAGAGPRGLFTLDAARRQSQLPQHDQCPVTPCPLVPIATAAVTAAQTGTDGQTERELESIRRARAREKEREREREVDALANR